jgi:segregation and condensation protein A
MPEDSAAPALHLEGFEGPLDFLLEMVRRQKVDVGRLSMAALCDQFVAAFEAGAGSVPLERRADWVVMASTLVALKAQLLAPATPEAAAAAEAAVDRQVRQWDELQAMRAAAAWLTARPQLGIDVFGHGDRPRAVRPQAELHVAFLEAMLAMLEGSDAPPDEEVPAYKLAPPDVWSFTEALARLLRLLQDRPDGAELQEFVPPDGSVSPLRARSGVASTFLAGLELTKQGLADMRQERPFGLIVVSPTVTAISRQ